MVELICIEKKLESLLVELGISDETTEDLFFNTNIEEQCVVVKPA